MKLALRTIAFLAVCIFAAFAISACAARLLPLYNQAIYSNATNLNEQALVLFSEMSDGVSAAKYAEFKPKYDKVIGGFEALQVTISGRSIPASAAGILLKFPMLSEICTAEFSQQDCLNASAPAVAGIVGILNEMKDEHELHGVEADLVAIYKRQYLGRVGILMEFEILLQDEEK